MLVGAILLSLALAAEARPAAGAADEIAVLQIPLQVPLAPLAARLEREIPKQSEKLDAYELEPKRRRYGAKYVARREAMRVHGAPNFLQIGTRVHYGVRACRRTYNVISDEFVMFPCVSCGLEEPRRVAELTVHSQLSWAPDWHLRSRTRAMPARFENRCRVTFFGIDLTERVIAKWVDSELRAIVRTVDRDTPRLTNIRADAERIWRELHVPQRLSPSLWLVIEPLSASFSAVKGEGAHATTTLTLLARTRAVPALPPNVPVRPLPRLGNSYGGDSFRVPLPAELTYREAAAQLVATGPLTTAENDVIRISAASLQPLSPSRIRLNAHVEVVRGRWRRFSGAIQLDGDVQLDPMRQQLRIVRLDYVARSANPFFKLLDRFLHERVRAQLERAAVWDLAPIVAPLRANASRALTRSLAPNAQLTTNIESVTVRGVALKPQTFVVDLLAKGKARVELRIEN